MKNIVKKKLINDNYLVDLENVDGSKTKSDNEIQTKQKFKNYSSEKIKLPEAEIDLSGNLKVEINRKEKDNNIHTKYNSKSEVEEKISSIFQNFSKYSNEEKCLIISQSAILKLVKNLNILNETNLKLNDIDIIFKKVSQSNKLKETQFFNFIVKLAEKTYPNEFNSNKKECISKFVFQKFAPLCKLIKNKEIDLELPIAEYTQKAINQLINYPISSAITGVINSIYFTLREIYIRFFEMELTKNKEIEKIEDDSLQNFTVFCKEYDIIPFILTQDQMTSYYRSIINFIPNRETEGHFNLDSKRELGICFSLSRFCVSLIHFSIIYFGKTNYKKFKSRISEVEKLVIFLEKLENSDGLKNLEKKRNRTHFIKLSFLPSRDILKMADCDRLNMSDDNKENSKIYQTFYKTNSTTIKNNNDNENEKIKNFLKIKGDSFEMIHSKIDIIRDVFIHYSSKGDKLNYDKMSLTSFKKFIHDCGVVREMPKASSILDTSKMNKTKSLSKSPIKKNYSDDTNLSNTTSFKAPKGKLSESDINIIFLHLTGPKNFDNSFQIKNQFNKNYGFIGNFEGNLTKSIIIDKKDYISSDNPSNKLNFLLFLKSFELIAMKIFQELKLDDAVEKFFTIVSLQN